MVESSSAMQILQGNGVIGGVALAKILVLKARPEIEKQEISDTKSEILRLEAALANVKADMEAEIANADMKSQAVLQAQLMILEDDSFVKEVQKTIEQEKICVEYAAVTAGKSLADEFRHLEDSYMQARSEDMLQVSERVSDKLIGFSNQLTLHEEVILMAEEFTPAQLASFDKKYVKGLVAHKGNIASHTAILAGNYGLPYVFGVATDLEVNGKMGLLDGDKGSLVINPDTEALSWAQARMEAQAELLVQSGARTQMQVLANISCLGDVEQALNNHADGIGLFRTEFLFMNRSSAPSEAEQYEVYKKVLQSMGEKPVIIRTIDIGTDKSVPYLELPKEENPALGLRGVRVSLTFKSMFQEQLKALLRAAVDGNLSVMFPMITSVRELDAIKEQVIQAIKELEEKQITYKMPKFGIMVETPAAAICSEELAKQVDFFSIGTNDLTQYTLALDRQGEGLDAYYDPHHESILKLIEMTIESGHKQGIPVGICGQLGSDVDIVPRLVKAGLDEVSVAIASIPKVRQAVLKAEGKEIAQETFMKDETVALVPEAPESQEKTLTFTYTITDQLGIHARPAGEIAKLVKGFDAKVVISCNCKTAEAKSVIKLMKLGAKNGSVLEVSAEGKDAAQALEALERYLEEKM